jgi:hypothetical protein
MYRGGVRVRGGGFTSGRIGSHVKKTNSKKDVKTPTHTSSLMYRKPTIFQTTQKPLEQQPQKSGLKLVLKRASGNAYKVKAIDMNRPKREAAQKVKFTFSDNEEEMPSNKIRKIDYNYSQYGDDDDDDDSESESEEDDEIEVVEIKQPKIQQKLPLKQQENQINYQKPVQRVQKAIKSSKPVEPEPEVINFDSEEIIPQTIEEKMQIACKQPVCKIAHSKPFPIALVEEKTSVVYSKALLLNHLYLSYASPCILCPLCRKFLTVTEFTKHIHTNHENENEDDKSSNKSFNILPYRTKSQITEYDKSTWRLFSKRFAEYKRDRLLKRERQRIKQKISNKNRNKENDVENSSNNNNNNKQENDYLKSIKSLNWNYVSKDKSVFIINKTLLENDQIVNLNPNGLSCDINITDTQSSSIKNDNKINEDLVLSEDEEEDEDRIEENRDKIMEDDIDEIKHSDYDEDDEKEESSSSSSSSMLLNYNLPSIKSRYFNFYENLNYETLMYICDNQYTIIPTTYIEYIHCKCDNNTTKSSYYLNALIL